MSVELTGRVCQCCANDRVLATCRHAAVLPPPRPARPLSDLCALHFAGANPLQRVLDLFVWCADVPVGELHEPLIPRFP